jgi:hypothetical protein
MTVSYEEYNLWKYVYCVQNWDVLITKHTNIVWPTANYLTDWAIPK